MTAPLLLRVEGEDELLAISPHAVAYTKALDAQRSVLALVTGESFVTHQTHLRLRFDLACTKQRLPLAPLGRIPQARVRIDILEGLQRIMEGDLAQDEKGGVWECRACSIDGDSASKDNVGFLFANEQGFLRHFNDQGISVDPGPSRLGSEGSPHTVVLVRLLLLREHGAV